MARAMISLPQPVGPVIKTVVLRGASSRARRYTGCMMRELPIIPWQRIFDSRLGIAHSSGGLGFGRCRSRGMRRQDRLSGTAEGIRHSIVLSQFDSVL